LSFKFNNFHHGSDSGLGRLCSSFGPTVFVTHGDHRGENVVPRARFGHDRVREHATIPADVAERFARRAVLAA